MLIIKFVELASPLNYFCGWMILWLFWIYSELFPCGEWLIENVTRWLGYDYVVQLIDCLGSLYTWVVSFAFSVPINPRIHDGTYYKLGIWRCPLRSYYIARVFFIISRPDHVRKALPASKRWSSDKCQTRQLNLWKIVSFMARSSLLAVTLTVHHPHLTR